MRMSVRGLAALRTGTQLTKRLTLKTPVVASIRASGFHTSRAALLVLGEKCPCIPNPLTTESLLSPSWKRVLPIELTSKKKLVPGKVSSCSPLLRILTSVACQQLFPGHVRNNISPGSSLASTNSVKKESRISTSFPSTTPLS